MPQIVGSGCALFDFDNDGRLDIYLIQNGGPNGPRNRLFHQNPDGTFTDVSAASGLDVAGYGMGVAIGDVNNDGLPDVLLTSYRGVRLFLNQGGGKFKEVTRQAGLDDPHWATSAAFFDFDRDGWLDLVVVNYLLYDPARPCVDRSGGNDYCGPDGFAGTVTKLYRNLGNGSAVRFEDVTQSSGLGSKTGPGFGVLCADFDGDGWPDIFVTNDGKPNHLWMNQHDGTFKEEGVVRGVAYNAFGQTQANMGIAFADISGNGLFDIYVTHLTEESNILWSQTQRGIFQDRTAATGLAAPTWRATGFGTAFVDFQNSGSPGLAVVNGRVKRVSMSQPDPQIVKSLGEHWSAYAERNQLFAAKPDGGFRDVSAENPSFCGTPNVARGLACGDIYNDGAVCMLVTTIAGPVRLYRSIAAGSGHWLLVRATDPALGGRDMYGAKITVEAGGLSRVGWVNPASSYLSSGDPRVHFGLGQVQAVQGIDVLWPDGMKERFGPCAVDHVIQLEKGAGQRS